jgi:hypothetical protein
VDPAEQAGQPGQRAPVRRRGVAGHERRHQHRPAVERRHRVGPGRAFGGDAGRGQQRRLVGVALDPLDGPLGREHPGHPRRLAGQVDPGHADLERHDRAHLDAPPTGQVRGQRVLAARPPQGAHHRADAGPLVPHGARAVSSRR